MKKYVVLSTNEDPKYCFFTPIVTWAWNKLGWDVVILTKNRFSSAKSDFAITLAEQLSNQVQKRNCFVHEIGNVEGFRDATLVQCSRLFASALFHDKETYLMTGDIDMLPLSDYWKFDPDKITAWGRDLSDKHFPICYVGMKVKKWEDIGFGLSPITNLLSYYLNLFSSTSKSDDWEKWWQVDQDILTHVLIDINKGPIIRIDRGIASNSHYPLGRIDRGAWDKTLEQKERIDSHLLRPGYIDENFNKIFKLIQETFPKENIDWMVKYKNEFCSL